MLGWSKDYVITNIQMETKTCFVTCFYDLGKIENNSERRQSDKYYEYAEEVLKRPIDLIFVGEESDVTRVWSIRRKSGFADKTFCLTLPFDKLPFFEHIKKLTETINTNGIYGFMNDKRLTPHYIVLTWCKLYFLKKAAELNPFDASHYCWVDFGYFHMRDEYDFLKPGQVGDDCFLNINNSWKLQEPNPHRFRICVLKDYDEEMMIDARKYYSKDNYQVAATVMGGDKEAIERVWEKVQKQITLIMKLGIAAVEENVLGRISYFFPELFDFTHGYYSTSLQNFAEITKYPNDVSQLSIKWRNAEKREIAYDLLSKLAEGIMNGRADTIENSDIFNIFYELIICAYYIHYPSYRKYCYFFRDWLLRNNIEISGLLNMNLSF